MESILHWAASDSGRLPRSIRRCHLPLASRWAPRRHPINTIARPSSHEPQPAHEAALILFVPHHSELLPSVPRRFGFRFLVLASPYLTTRQTRSFSSSPRCQHPPSLPPPSLRPSRYWVNTLILHISQSLPILLACVRCSILICRSHPTRAFGWPRNSRSHPDRLACRRPIGHHPRHGCSR